MECVMNDRVSSIQVSLLKHQLSTRLGVLRGILREHLLKSDDDRMRLLADRVGDEEDASVSDLLVDLDLAEIDRDIEELRDVEAALERIRVQAYGVCIGCGSAVPFERLRAYPTAKRCIRCQRAREKAFAHTPTPSL